jgi:hypothetical protein
MLSLAHSRQLKAKPRHTAPVLIDRGSAVFLWVRRVAEEHAFVAGGFFFFADAAGLGIEGIALVYSSSLGIAVGKYVL